MKIKKILALISALVILLCGMYVLANAQNAGQWSVLRAYSGTAGNIVSGDDGCATLTGYGAAKFSKTFTINDGDSVSVTLSDMSLTAGKANQLDLVFTNESNSFFSSVNDVGDGLRVNLTSWGSLGGMRLWYSGITNGQKVGETYFPKQVTSPIATSTVTYTLTKKTQTIGNVDYTFVLTEHVTNTANSVIDDTQSVNIPATLLPADTFDGGLTVSTGSQYLNGETPNNIYKISAPVYTAAGGGDSSSGSSSGNTSSDSSGTSSGGSSGTSSGSSGSSSSVSAIGGFLPVRGYGLSSGTGTGLSKSGNSVSFTGLGGTSYIDKAVKTAVSVDFQLNKHPESGYWFAVGLSNKEKVFWKPDGSESQGIVAMITSFGDDSGINVAVKNIKNNGMFDIGTITSKVNALNTKHTISFYQNENNWCVAIDGGQYVTVSKSDIALANKSYLTVGASGDPSMQMAVQGMKFDGAVLSSEKGSDQGSAAQNPDSTAASSATVGGFSVVRGYGRPETSGNGLSIKGKTVSFDGFGGTAYVEKAIKEAVSVTYKLGSHPDTGYWFSFGLVNTKGVFWKPDGSESQGIVVLITAFGDGSGINVMVKNTTSDGTANVTTMTSKIKAIGTDHVITFYKDEDNWVIAIDGSAKAKIVADGTGLAEENYLIAGASNMATMHFEVSDIFIDDKVTSEMKSGVLVAASAGTATEAAAVTTGGTSYDQDGNLLIGEITKGSALDYLAANNRVDFMSGSIPTLTYILAGVLGIFILASAGYAGITFLKKKRGVKKDK